MRQQQTHAQRTRQSTQCAHAIARMHWLKLANARQTCGLPTAKRSRLKQLVNITHGGGLEVLVFQRQQLRALLEHLSKIHRRSCAWQGVSCSKSTDKHGLGHVSGGLCHGQRLARHFPPPALMQNTLRLASAPGRAGNCSVLRSSSSSTGWCGVPPCERAGGGVLCSAREAAARTKSPGMLLRPRWAEMCIYMHQSPP